jgi:hypothetical protein
VSILFEELELDYDAHGKRDRSSTGLLALPVVVSLLIVCVTSEYSN